jgi:predicted RNA-binding protein associated with RNAse of E/G family
VHPPKTETFDVAAGTNTDPKGFVRPVRDYQVQPFGLYMSREMQGHPKLAWVDSWLLPSLGIRVTDWWFNPGHQRDQDYYIDIVDVTRDGDVWRTVDHYLDIVVRTGRDAQVIDLDEYVEAVAAGVLDPAAAERALVSSYRTVDGLGAHGHDVGAWLAGQGMPLTWRR